MGEKIFHAETADFSKGRLTFLNEHAETADFSRFYAKIPPFYFATCILNCQRPYMKRVDEQP